MREMRPDGSTPTRTAIYGPILEIQLPATERQALTAFVC